MPKAQTLVETELGAIGVVSQTKSAPGSCSGVVRKTAVEVLTLGSIAVVVEAHVPAVREPPPIAPVMNVLLDVFKVNPPFTVTVEVAVPLPARPKFQYPFMPNSEPTFVPPTFQAKPPVTEL